MVSREIQTKWGDVLWCRANFKQCGAIFYSVARISSNVGRCFMVSREIQAMLSELLPYRATKSSSTLARA